jgi:hypothetical protein
MSEICKTYNLSEEDYKRMVRDGIIAATIFNYDEIYTSFKNNLSNSSGTEDAVYKTCITHRCERWTVYRAISKFK